MLLGEPVEDLDGLGALRDRIGGPLVASQQRGDALMGMPEVELESRHVGLRKHEAFVCRQRALEVAIGVGPMTKLGRRVATVAESQGKRFAQVEVFRVLRGELVEDRRGPFVRFGSLCRRSLQIPERAEHR